MADTVLAPWTMPSEVIKSLPPNLRKAGEDCHLHLDKLIKYDERRWTFVAMFVLGFFSFLMMLICHPRWGLLFRDFSTTEMIALFVATATGAGILGFKVGSAKGRAEALAAKQTLLMWIWSGGPELEALARIRDLDPREEYRHHISALMTEANEGYGPEED